METEYRPLLILLRWVGVLLVLILLAEIVWLVPGWSLGKPEGTLLLPTESAEQQDSELPSLEEYEKVINRTIFSWNRKPVAGAQLIAEQDDQLGNWLLTGLVNTGFSTYAIFSEVDGDRQLKLEQDMEIGKWSIEEVGTESVVLTAGDERKVIPLSVSNKKQGKERVPSGGKEGDS